MEEKQVLIVMIALADLFVPDWNPRKFIEEAKLLALMAYLQNGGEVPRPLVWKGSGKAPWAIIAGQMRCEAYRRLGWTHLKVEIMDITLEEAKNLANSSNEKADLFWLDRYEGWENRMKEEFWDLSTLAVKMGVSDSETSRAMRILRVLNAHSRQLIRETLPDSVAKGAQKGPKTVASIPAGDRAHDFRPFSEGPDGDPEDPQSTKFFTSRQALPLTAFLSANPKEDEGDLKAQALAEKALPVMIARRMPEAQGRGLVKQMKAGGRPEDYDPQKTKTGLNHEGIKGTKEDKPNGLVQQTARPGEPPKTARTTSPTLTKGGQGAGFPSEPAHPNRGSRLETPTQGGFSPSVQGSGSNSPTANSPLLTGSFWRFLVGWAKQSAAQNLGHTLNQAIQYEVRRLVKAAVLFIIFAAVVFFLSGSLTRTIGWFLHLQPQRTAQTDSPTLAKGATLVEAPSRGQSLGSAGSQEEPAPGGFSPSTGSGQASTANAVSSPKPVTLAQAVVSKKVPAQLARRQKKARLALEFVRHLYGYDYRDMETCLDFFKKNLDEEAYEPFMNRYFPPEKVKEIIDWKFYSSFKPTRPVKFLKSDVVGDSFLVQGVMTTWTNRDGSPMLISNIPVALKVALTENSDPEDKIEGFIELTPSMNKELSEGMDVAPAASSQSDLVTAAADAVGNAAKKTLGF